jgi:octaprenyl-diphosphate synthase
LLHDDVVDEGMERRGAVTARRRFGNGVSVLAGDLLLVRSLELTTEARPDLMPGLVATLASLIDGELVQLGCRNQLDITEATYFRILKNKTASLFRWATSTGAELGGASPRACERLGLFGENLGVAFQLVDDVLDYAGENTGKTLFADLNEGKLTLPLVLAAAGRPEIAQALERVRLGEQELVPVVGKMVTESGACDEVRRRARRATEAAVKELADVPPCPAKALLRDVALELAGRAG